MFNIYKTYSKVKHIFVKPRIRFNVYYGLNTKYFGFTYSPKYVYIPTYSNIIKVTKNGKTYYEQSSHKLKSGFRFYRYQWRSNIRKKLRKFGLGWFKPTFKIPNFLVFDIKNWDLQWKTKYSDYRYEGAPLFEITLFGVSFSWSLHAPVGSFYFDDNYWESILTYIYNNLDSIKDLDKIMGTYVASSKTETTKDYVLDIAFLKEPYKTIVSTSRQNVQNFN